MSDKPLPTTQPQEPAEGLDAIQFWELYRGKLILGAAFILVVTAAIIVWRSTTENTLARAEDALGNAKTLDDYRQIIVNYPKSATAAKAMMLLANESFRSAQYDVAIDNYRNFVSQFSDHSLVSSAAYGIAASLEAKGDLRGAIDAYTSMLSKYPESFQSASARLGIGRCYEGLQDWESAKRAYEGILTTQPDSILVREAERRLFVVKRHLTPEQKPHSPPSPETKATP